MSQPKYDDYALSIGKIPAYLFADVLWDYMEEHDISADELEILVGRCHVRKTDQRLIGDNSLRPYLSGKYRWVSFDLVDEVLCKLGMDHRFREEPLEEWYHAVDLRTKYERQRDNWKRANDRYRAKIAARRAAEATA